MTNTLTRLFIISALLFGLAACGKGSKEPAAEAPKAEEPQASAPMEDMKEEMKDEMDGMKEEMEDMKEAMEDTPVAEVMDGDEPSDANTVAAAPVMDDDGNACTLSVEAGDSIAYSTNALSVPASCGEVTVTLTHTGNLPAAAMGHNWVLMPEDAVSNIATAGMSAGPGANYLPDDDRIVAATKIVGGGESASVTFSLSNLVVRSLPQLL